MTNVLAKALRELADAAETKEVVKTEVAKPKAWYAIYGEQIFYPYGPSGTYITEPNAIEEYYKLYPAHRPRPWSLKSAGAPRYLVEITPGNEEAAKNEADQAIAGLKIIEKGQTTNSSHVMKYHIFKISEGTA